MDLNSSVLWGIIGLIGGFTTSLIFYKIGLKSKKLVYSIKSQVLITDNLSKIDGLKVLFFDKPITNLSTTTISIKSIGKDIVEMTDFAKSSPLYINTDGEFLLKDNIESTLTNNSNPLNMAKPIIISPSEIAVEYDYFSKNDTITFTVLHTGNLNVTGKIKNGLLIKDDLDSKRNFIISIISYVLLVVCSALVIFMYFVATDINSTIVRIINFGLNLLIGILIIGYGKKVFKENFGNNIDINNSHVDYIDLRDNKENP